jgi:hypothetical protein
VAGAKRPDGKAAKTERVTFTRPAAERIGRVVRIVEAGDRKEAALVFGSRSATPTREHVRLGKITATWEHGTSATVERLDGDGNPFDPPSTFTATNYFTTVNVAADGERYVACGLVGDTWILIEAERGCETQAAAIDLDADADDASSDSDLEEGAGVEVLLNVGGCAKWFKLTKKTVVVDVRYESDELTKDLKDVWLFEDIESLTTETIVGTTQCEESPEE